MQQFNLNIITFKDYIIASFEWIHICVSMIPILLFCFIVFSLILNSYQITKIQKQELLIEDKFKLELLLTEKVLQRYNRFLLFLLFLEIINSVNWDRYLIIFNGLFLSTPYISAMVCILLCLTRVLLKLLLNYMYVVKVILIDFATLILFILFFLFVIVFNNNLIILYIGLEGVTLALCISFILIKVTNFFSDVAVKNKNISYYKIIYNVFCEQKLLHQNSITSSVFYFLLNSFVSILFSLTIFFCLFFFHTTNITDLYYHFHPLFFTYFNIELYIVSFLLLVCFCFKLGIAPFHFWLPSVYTGANYFMIFLLAIPVKIALVFIFWRLILFNVFDAFINWTFLLTFLGCLSMIIGSLGLLTHVEIKKFLAYSTINHFGGMFLVLGMGTNTFASHTAFFYYFIIYIIMTIGFLVFVSSMIRSDTNQSILTIGELNTNKFLGTIPQIYFAIILFSMLGLPPLLGFWGKFLILEVLIANNINLWGDFLICIFLGTTIIAAYGYLNVIKLLFIKNLNQGMGVYEILPFSSYSRRILLLCCFLLIFGGSFQYCPYLIQISDEFFVNFFFSGVIIK